MVPTTRSFTTELEKQAEHTQHLIEQVKVPKHKVPRRWKKGGGPEVEMKLAWKNGLRDLQSQ